MKCSNCGAEVTTCDYCGSEFVVGSTVECGDAYHLCSTKCIVPHLYENFNPFTSGTVEKEGN